MWKRTVVLAPEALARVADAAGLAHESPEAALIRAEALAGLSAALATLRQKDRRVAEAFMDGVPTPVADRRRVFRVLRSRLLAAQANRVVRGTRRKHLSRALREAGQRRVALQLDLPLLKAA